MTSGQVKKSGAGIAVRGRTLLFGLGLSLFALPASAGVPVVQGLRVTDVATRSFAIVGTISEPSTAALSLFAADCTTPVTGFTTDARQHSASGNMRITVTGLSAGTHYCCQLTATSVSTSEAVVTATAPVTTAAAVERKPVSQAGMPAGNDIVAVPGVHLPSGETRDAILVTMELTGGAATSPLSLLLSVDPTRDYFNLNNLFAVATGKSLDLAGGERVKITENHGGTGCVVDRFRLIPADGGATIARHFDRPNPTDIDASGGVNILDVLRVAGGKGGAGSAPCFNSDLDLNGDGVIDSADFTMVKGGFNGLP